MYVKNFGMVVIQEITGPVSFLVKLQDGRIMRRHQDHLRRRLATPEQDVPSDGMQNRPSLEDTAVDVEIEIPSVTPLVSNPTDVPSSPTTGNTDVISSVGNSRPNESNNTPETTVFESNALPFASNTPSTAGSAKQYPRRNRKPPNRYM